MSLKLGDGFSYLARKPLDERLTFETIDDMVDLSDSSLYTGIISYNKETGKFYTFNVDNPVNTTLGKWREFFSTGAVSFTAAVDINKTSPTYGHLIITLTDGSTLDAGYIMGSNVATIAQYQANTLYTVDSIVYLNDKFARVLNDYTSGAIVTTIEDLFYNDTNLMIFGDIIDDTTASSTTTYSSLQIQNLLSTIGSSFIGSIMDDNASSFPSNAHEGNWCLIENCINNAPEQPGVGAYSAANGWTVTPIPTGEFEFPEPGADDGLYFRTRATGQTNGAWQKFLGIDGTNYSIQLNTTNNETYVPELNELVVDTTRNCIVLGDGTNFLRDIDPFYKITLTAADITTTLGYTPENINKKGVANGYAPLDSNGLVPAANLPANLIDTYSKTEIDNKDTNILLQATTLVNAEAALTRTNETTISDNLTVHTTNSAIHVTQSEKDSWDNKVDSSDLTQYDNHLSDTTAHVTQADKDKWNGLNKVYYVTDKTALPTEGNSVGNLGYVQVSAAGVIPVVCDTYLWNGTEWQQQDVGGVTLEMNWGNIKDKPQSSALALDNSVNVAHSHLNIAALNKIGQTDTGSFTYNGVEIGIRVVFVDIATMLPTEGKEDTLYVVYQDSRVRNYPSISVWRDGAYQILGRGTQDAPPVVGDLSILQNEYFSVSSNSKFRITVTQNQYFAFLPIEILKEIQGATNQSRTITDFANADKFDYDSSVIRIDTIDKIKFQLSPINMQLDSVGEQYHFSADVDLTKYKDISEVL